MLKGKNAVISGASSGMGKGIAEALSKQGVNLALIARSENKLKEVADLATKNSVQAHIICCDLTDTKSTDDAATKVGQVFNDKLDFLINCAGIGDQKKADEADVDVWHNILMTNLVNTMRFTRRLIPYLKKSGDGSAIVNIGSVSGTMTMSKAAAYGASKYGIRGFSNDLFEDLREYGIKVSVIQPGMVNTPMIGDSAKLDRSKMIQVEDVSDSVMYVLQCKPTVCPVEITIRPQKTPYT